MLRIGIGYDIHRVGDGNVIVLGGVSIKAQFGLIGHSDADVLLHSISDALLGAIGERDIGYYFCDSDDQYKNIESKDIIGFANGKIKELGYSIVNIDNVIIAENPLLNPYVEQIKNNIAEMLNILNEQINLKAKTNEECDSLGKGESIAVHSVVLLNKDAGS